MRRPRTPTSSTTTSWSASAWSTSRAGRIGTVTGVVHGAQDLLEIKAADGRPTLVPFVAALVPEVDVPGGRVVVADRPGLVAPFEESDGED